MSMSDDQTPSPEPAADAEPAAVLSDSSPRTSSFDPSRKKETKVLPESQLRKAIGIIKRKALIKELAAAYHVQCLSACQELLELQKKWDDPHIELNPPPEVPRKEPLRPSKRLKKSR